MKESLVVGFVYPQEVDGLFMQSVTTYILEDARRGKDSRMGYGRGGVIGVHSGPRIASARNELVNSFLFRTSAEWLLMVDTDMVFDTEGLDLLFEAADPEDVPIVGGLCFAGAFGAMYPTLYKFGEDGKVEKVYDYPEFGLCKVDGTGAAFLLMHREALQKIGKEFRGTYPWFAEGTVLGQMVFGEDLAFCLRAMKVGIPIHVHTGCKVGHVKPQILDEEAYRAYRAKLEEMGPEAFAEQAQGRYGLEKVHG